jgi:hypothetical protein
MPSEFKLEWDKIGEHLYETGTDRGVLYPVDANGAYPKGVAWNGLTAVTETPSGADKTDLWADNIKYLSMRAAEDFGYTIEAYTYPDEFAECDGSAYLDTDKGIKIGQQPRKAFGFAFRTILGNDTQLDDHGYLIHLCYNGTASPSERGYQTKNDSPEAITFSWEVATTPINVSGHKPTANIIIDSTKVDGTKLKAFEKILYGTGETEARLPLPDEVLSLFEGEG